MIKLVNEYGVVKLECPFSAILGKDDKMNYKRCLQICNPFLAEILQYEST